LGSVPSRCLPPLVLLGGLRPLLPLVWEFCLLHWGSVADVPQNIDDVGLREHYLVGSLKIEHCLDIVKIGPAVIQDGPRDPTALFGIEV
jgi:hypothetical protein